MLFGLLMVEYVSAAAGPALSPSAGSLVVSSAGALAALFLGPMLVACFLILVLELMFQDTWIVCDEQNSFTYRFLSGINAMRESIGKSPIWLVPAEEPESAMAQYAGEMFCEVQHALRTSPISSGKKAALGRQARQVQKNIVESLWKLSRLRRYRARIGNSPWPASHEVEQETNELESRLMRATQESLDVLQSLPVTLAILDLAREDRRADDLLVDLREASERIRDLAEGYEAVRKGFLDLHDPTARSRARG